MTTFSGRYGRNLHAPLLSAFALLAAALSLLALALPASASAVAQFTIVGRGWGHGIGMSQWGAQGYAKDYDWEYAQILTHYFQHARVATAPLSLTVKVNIERDAKARTSWKIRSGSAGRALVVADTSDATDRVTLSATASYWITVSKGNVQVRSDAVNVSGASVPGALIRAFSGAAYATTGSSAYLVQMLSSTGPFNSPGIRWRGSIYFLPSGTSASSVVNHVGMEQYLYGVVPRESPASFEPEALKAQAVAARSYAYTSANKGQTLFCTVQSQVYNGHSRYDTAYEDPRTNDAVDDTRSLVMKYGNDVIRTYFSSSAGGHTASVQDVWVISDPQPYYVGVASADGPYPYGTSWGAPIKMSGSQMADAMRSYDLGGNRVYDYSVAAPASVSSIAVERAASGFVPYIRMRWSNGQVFRIRGTTFQSALKLKSTKFYINVAFPPPLVTRRYQETDSRIAYGGVWSASASPRLSGGAQVYSGSAGASATIAFKGSGMRWVGNKAATYGRANVYVDGAYDRTVDLYSAKTMYDKPLWSIGGLSTDTTHTVLIRVLHAKAAASRGFTVALDAVDVFDGVLVAAPQPVATAQETNTRLAFAGTWLKASNPALSGAAHTYTTQTGARAVASFFGRGIRWISSVSPFGGSARVQIDGGVWQTLSLRSELTQYQRVVWAKAHLTLRAHTVVIEVLKPQAPSLGGPVALDAVQIVGGSLRQAGVPWQRLEQTAPSVAWSGSWMTSTSTALSGHSQRYSSVTGARATFSFDGRAVRWIGTRAVTYGKATVSIDGGIGVPVDLYAPRTQFKQLLFGRSGLSNAPHTMTVKVMGASRNVARGRAVAVDAFDVMGIGCAP